MLGGRIAFRRILGPSTCTARAARRQASCCTGSLLHSNTSVASAAPSSDRVCGSTSFSGRTNGLPVRMRAMNTTSRIQVLSPGMHLCTSRRNHSARSGGSATAAPNSEGDNDGDEAASVLSGEECYVRALRALETVQRIESQNEEQKAAEQFESMRLVHEREEERSRAKGNDNTSNNGSNNDARSAPRAKLAALDEDKGGGGMQSRAAGVAVVKTITRQTRKDRDDKVTRHTVGDSSISGGSKSEETNHKAEAQRWLHVAAFRHLHPKALVRLGNDALEEAKQMLHSPRDAKSHTGDDDSYDMPPGVRALSPIGRAVRLYDMAGKAGSAEGYFNLGHLLWTGFPEQERSDRDTLSSDTNQSAAAAAAAAAALDDSDLADIPLCHDSVLRMDRQSAIIAFKKAVQMADPDAMYFLGVYLLSVDDASREQRMKGLGLIDNAANIGHCGALYYLAILYLNGDERVDVEPCPTTEFVERLDCAADAGDSDALYLRAHCLYHGEDGYEQDYAAALDNFVQSAEAGNADAAISAGAMLHRGGLGGVIQRDRRRAFELYQEAAELGNVEGWRNLVACYALGEGVPKCERTARYIADTMLKSE